LWAVYRRVYVAVFATPEIGTVVLWSALVAPTAAACGSV
jgi:hypothetical protein